MALTLKDIKNSPILNSYMNIGNAFIGNIGAIEHNMHHAELTSLNKFSFSFNIY
ncbi:MAG: hypothetical protein ACOX6I_09340 [Syntrophomonadaceae bacterium]|jgi:hypothetical protein